MRTTVGIRLIRTDKDHRAALAEIEKLWGASIGTPEGDKLDVLVTSKPMRSGAGPSGVGPVRPGRCTPLRDRRTRLHPGRACRYSRLSFARFRSSSSAPPPDAGDDPKDKCELENSRRSPRPTLSARGNCSLS